MIDALVTGKLFKSARVRTAANGNDYTTVLVRVPTREDAIFINCITFDSEAQSALQALGDGEAVSLAGELSVSVYTDKEGNTRPSASMFVHKVLTAYHVSRKRDKTKPKNEAWQAMQ